MDQVIAQQILDANAEVDRYADRYIQEFWDAAKDIFGPISYKEKSGLAWKALYQKEGFLDQIGDIRDQLVANLNEIRRCLMEEALACKAGLADFKTNNLASLQTDLEAFSSELAEQAEVNTQDIVAEIDGLKESYDTVAEVDALEDFIYDLADIRPNPNGYGRSHADGV